jgi:hypothetical protein
MTNFASLSFVIASNAKQSSAVCAALDCRAAAPLAMTIVLDVTVPA